MSRKAAKTQSKILYLGLILFWLLSSCGHEQQKSKRKIGTASHSKESEKPDSLEGYWILASFQDSVIQYKSIAKFRLQRPFWSAYILKVTRDSIITYGSFFETYNQRLLKNDTLLKYSFHGDFRAVSNKGKDTLYMFQKREDNRSYPHNCEVPFIYRKLKEDERELVEFNPDNERSYNSQLKEKFRLYCSKNILQGKYKSTQGLPDLVFNTNETLSGLEGYNKYDLNDYFGTFHPFDNNDVFGVYDTTGNKKQGKCFAWEFKNGLFILQEMVPELENGIDYIRNGKRFVYRKEN